MSSTPRVLQHRVQDPLRSTTMPQPEVGRFTVRIGGLTCASDAVRLERTIQSLPGVIDVMVNPVTEIAYVTVDLARTTSSDVCRAIDATPYGPAAR